MTAAHTLHDIIGSSLFWTLVNSECLKFFHWESKEGIYYDDERLVSGGELVTTGKVDEDNTPQTVHDIIRNMFHPEPGKEREVEQLFNILEQNTFTMPIRMSKSIPSLTKGILLLPSIRSMLGISDAMPIRSIPRWNIRPILRLAKTLRTGFTGMHIGAVSCKLEFGLENLASHAFPAATGEVLADHMAGYILTRNFSVDVGAAFVKDPSLIKILLKFRESATGARLRDEVLGQLRVQSGSDFIGSVNAGLKATVPLEILQRAQDELSGLLVLREGLPGQIPAVWKNRSYRNGILNLWKKRSARDLTEHCKIEKISMYSACPCGSGEKFRFCCARALDVSIS